MTKQPEEVKKGLGLCGADNSCSECPYYINDSTHMCIDALLLDALARIQQLEADNAQRARSIDDLTDKLNATNDLISRSELLAALRQALKDAWERRAVPMSGVSVILKILEIVQKIPAVNAENVQQGAQEEDNAEKTSL